GGSGGVGVLWAAAALAGVAAAVSACTGDLEHPHTTRAAINGKTRNTGRSLAWLVARGLGIAVRGGRLIAYDAPGEGSIPPRSFFPFRRGEGSTCRPPVHRASMPTTGSSWPSCARCS